MVSRDAHPRRLAHRPKLGDGSSTSSAGSLRSVLAGCVLAICANERESVQDLLKVARALGARLSKVSNEEVTHLISEASVVAASPTAQVLVPAWLRACETAGTRVPEKEYRVPVLAGLEIVPSSLTIPEKNEIKRVTERCGAVFTRALERSCTHLVTPVASGKKYEFALYNGNIAIVTPQWLFESAEAGRRLDEELYKPEEELSPKAEGLTPPRQPAPVEEPPPPPKSSSPEKLPTLPKRDGKEDEDAPEAEPRPSSRPSPAPAPAPAALAESVSNLSQRPGGRLRRPRTKPASLLLDSLCMYLTSCPTWNSAAHAPLRARTLRIAACAGAAISPRWTASVNTVVVVSVPILAEQIKSITLAESRGARVVGIAWLEKCVEAGAILPTSAAPVPEWRASAGASASQSQALGFPFGDKGPSSQSAPTSNIFHGARISLGPLALRDPGAIPALSSDISAGRGKVLPHNESGLVTAGVPTHVMCPKSLNAAEHAVVSAIRTQNARVICVTPLWAQSCVDEKCLLPVRLCVLFSPVQRVAIPEMGELAITISGFQQRPAATDWNRRRSTLASLIRLLGAKFQERMRRRATSVLVADDAVDVLSEKVKSAREWDIPVVSHTWLLACAAQGRVVPYEMHPLQLAPKPPRGARPRERPRSRRVSSQHPGASQRLPSQGPPSQMPLSQAPPPPSPMPDLSTISLFNKFTSTMKRANDDAADDGAAGSNLAAAGAAGPLAEEARRRSRSASLDAQDWDDDPEVPGSASQSQVIVHRDLTPPHSPVPSSRRPRRTLPPRSAKAKRARIDV